MDERHPAGALDESQDASDDQISCIVGHELKAELCREAAETGVNLSDVIRRRLKGAPPYKVAPVVPEANREMRAESRLLVELLNRLLRLLDGERCADFEAEIQAASVSGGEYVRVAKQHAEGGRGRRTVSLRQLAAARKHALADAQILNHRITALRTRTALDLNPTALEDAHTILEELRDRQHRIHLALFTGPASESG
jgi:hypothetical protein